MPRKETVERALEEIRKRQANYEYFFDRLRSTDWVKPLLSHGMFQNPPPPEREGRYIRFPFWPQSRYLARVASQAPELILEVVLKIPDTENVRVHEDLCDTACAMPPSLAARWARRETSWINSQPYLYVLLPEKLGALAAHLARGGEVDAALELARALLAIFPEKRESCEAHDDLVWHVSSECVPRFEILQYKDVLEQYTPDLIAAAGDRALALLCDLLRTAVGPCSCQEEREGGRDNSFIWRPAVEDHAQNEDDDLRSILVSAVRDAGEALMDKDGKRIVEMIETGPFDIFRRIGFHLRRKWFDVDIEGTARLVTDPAVLGNVELHHEIFLLLREHFNRFPEAYQDAYLNLVVKGEEVERQLDEGVWDSAQDMSSDERQRHVRQWQYRKLWPIRDFLGGDWKRRFTALSEEFGEIEHADFLHFWASAVSVGPTSPKSAEALRSMSVGELIGFLSSWCPTEDPLGPSPEGLGQELITLVTADPQHFAAEAERFKGLEPVYVGALLRGLCAAAKQNLVFSWQSVLGLCCWVLDQPREIPGRKVSHFDRDLGWVSVRRAIAELLSAGFESNASQVPFDHRASVWEILGPLTNDPEPTLEHEAKYGGSNMDPATLSINTTRGEAMHALLRYALWVARNLQRRPGEKGPVAHGFEAVPEAREVLEEHLDPAHEPSLTVRAVYGWWFPQLVLFDERWTVQNTPRIFPTESKFQALRNAAWETYILYSTLHNRALEVLHKEYRRAVQEMSLFSRSMVWRTRDPSQRLAEHLMVFYLQGRLELEEPSGLLPFFYEKAPLQIRRHALSFVGRTLRDTKGILPSDVLTRASKLWMQRLDASQKLALDDADKDELSAFGSWFASAKLDDAWALEQLKTTLKLGVKVELDHLVAQHLAALASDMPEGVLECLNLMVERDEEGWGVGSWGEHARAILVVAVGSPDDAVREGAANLIHRLGAMGHFGFRDILSKNHG